MKHKIITFSFAISALIIYGCSNSQSSSSGNAQNNSAQTKRVAFVTNNASDYWTIARTGTEKADAELADI